VAKVLRYVNFEPDTLMDAYRSKFATSGMAPETQSALMTELAAGLDGYTYLEE
jgi:arginine decarboxylase